MLFGDHPFIKEYSLNYFLERCDIKNYDVFHGAPKKESIELFNEFYSAGYLHTKEYVFRAGCMFLIKPQKMDFTIINAVYRMRVQEKVINNIRLLKLIFTEVRNKLGWDALGALSLFSTHMWLRFLYNRKANLYYDKLKNSEKSSITHLEAYAAKLISPNTEKIKAKLIALPFGELSLDVDSLKDLENYEKNYNKILEIMEQERAMSNVVDLNEYKILNEYKRKID